MQKARKYSGKINYGEFDSAYLYMKFNGGKLIKLPLPELVTLLEFSH